MENSLNVNEMKALVSLLGDTDMEVVALVEQKIISLGEPIIPVLEQEWEQSFDPISQKRIEEIIQEKKNSIENFTRRLAPVMREKFLRVNSILNQTIWKLDNIVKKTIQHKVVQLEKREEIVRHEFKKIIADSRHYLDMAQQKASLTDPNIILARGYSITTYNGRALKNPDLLENNALIITRLFKGNITSEVKTIKKEN